jgi:hypothetical protein
VDAQAPVAGPEQTLEREWWLRTLSIFQAPRAVFGALRDDSDRAMEARQEPVLLLVLLAGVAGVLTSPTTGRLMNNPDRDGLLVAVLVFITAIMYGFATFWIGGGVVYMGMRGAGGTGSYRRARHVLAFAAAPLALWLVAVFPVELAVFGGDLFRTGGADGGVSYRVFQGIQSAFFLWALVLLGIGIAAVERWKTVRALGALGLSLFVLIGLALLPYLL